MLIHSVEKDRLYLERLQKHLVILERTGLISLWCYEHTHSEWEVAGSAREAFSAADLHVFLLSIDFLAAFDLQRLWPLIAERIAAKQCVIIPVYAGYCELADTPFSSFWFVNSPSVPLASMSESEQEGIWLQLAVSVRRYAQAASAETLAGLAWTPPGFQNGRNNGPVGAAPSRRDVMPSQDDEDLLLAPSARQELDQALLSAFPRLSDLEMLVTFKLNKNLETIVSQRNLAQAVFELINWAIANGCLRQLVHGASEQNPGNALLRAFVRKYL